MGALIVPRLMQAAYTVTGWNRSRDKAQPLIEAGMEFAETPRAVAEQSEIVFSILTDATAVRAVALGADGLVSGLRKDGLYIDMSTIDPTPAARSPPNSPRWVHHARRPIPQPRDRRLARPVMIEATKRLSAGAAAIGPKVTRIGGNGLLAR
jgi:hypothetical protein